jgi:hypothetical protein
MKISILGRYALSISAVAAMVSGCSGSQTGISGALPRTAVGGLYGSHAAHPNSGQDLLYVSGFANSAAALFIFTYPQGQHRKTITGYPLGTLGGDCADDSGRAYAVNASGSQVLVYAHGGTSPMRILNTDANETSSCSVDRNTGDLAVFGSKLLIYPKSKGPPKGYSYLPYTSPVGCDYDNKWDLFIEGVSEHRKIGQPWRVTLSELAKGASQLVSITIPRIEETNSIGSDRWDGKYLALGNGAGRIYRLAISGGKAKTIGVVSLDGSFDVGSIWIQGGRIAGANYDSRSVMIWDYPKGGEPTKVINNVGSGDGVAVSVAPPR